MKRIFVLGYFIIINFNLLAQTTYYPSGKIDEIIDPVTNIHTSYYEDGTLKSKYKFIMPTGYEGEVVFYHPNGKKNSKSTYKKGKKEGLCNYYFESGLISIEGNYINDKKEGEHNQYFESGKIKIKENYIKDNWIKHIEYYENGQISMVQNSKNNMFNGETLFYYEDGKMKSKEFYVNGLRTGEVVYYYPNGNIEMTFSEKNGKHEGVSYKYYENGNISLKGFWKNDEKAGTWIDYNKDGTVSSTEFFSSDMPIETTAKVQSNTNIIPKKSPNAITPPTPIAQRKNKPIRVDAFDFMDYPKKYIGKTVTLTVFYSSDNEKVINQPESRENTSEMYYDNLCQCLKPKDRYSKVGTHAVHWKKFIEVNSVASITINVPKSFFMDNKIPQNFGKGHLDIDIDVYSGESRKSPEKGEYSESLSSENYELVNIRRHRY